jgi:hypothetical protein
MNSAINTNKHFYHHLQNRQQIRCPQKNTNKCYEISPTKKKEILSTKEYELKQNIFDPTKQSPPNNFMQKLQQRVGIYN